MKNFNNKRIVRSVLISLGLVLCCLSINVGGSESKCSASGTTYFCPNCGGIEVSNCLACDGYFSTDTKHDICFDRKLFSKKNVDPENPDDHYHFLWNDLVGAIVWFVCAGIATACGVGGGGIYVPLGILLFQFAPKQASGLSQASIFGASVGGLLLNARNRHPNKKIRSDPGTIDHGTEEEADQNHQEGKEEHHLHPRRHLQQEMTQLEEEEYVAKGGKFYARALINYDMALFLAPMEMAGAVLGLLVQKILPDWLYLLIAALVLSFTCYKTYKKFFQTRDKENKARQKALEQTNNNENVTNVDVVDVNIVRDSRNTASSESDDNDKAEMGDNQQDGEIQEDHEAALRKKYLAEDMRQYPKEKLFALALLWVVLFLLVLLKGGKGVESLVGITCESPWYMVLLALQFVWLLCFSLYYGLQAVKCQADRVKVKYPYLPEDPIWDMKALRTYGIFTFIAGIVAGLIGIGGGMVLGPLMLVMGIHPSVSSATTATMIVLTSSSIAVMYVTSGLVPWEYAVFYFCTCLSGAYLGKSKIDGYVKKSGRASMLIFILATIIGLATVGSLFIMFTRLAAKNWCLDGLHEFCDVSADDSDEDSCIAHRMLSSAMANNPFHEFDTI